jgi:hypothetical protein
MTGSTPYQSTKQIAEWIRNGPSNRDRTTLRRLCGVFLYYQTWVFGILVILLGTASAVAIDRLGPASVAIVMAAGIAIDRLAGWWEI